jgi:hypothetical protein
MSDRGVEARLLQLEGALAQIARRVETLERAAAPDESNPGPATADVFAPPIMPRTGVAPDALPGALMFVGRTAMALGGAYFLRAVTEAGGLGRHSGVLLGLTYAGVWVAVADRAASRHRLSGLVHGVTAVVIGLPLLWEASTRFAVLTPASSMFALMFLTTATLAAAWHRRLPVLAGVGAIGAVCTAIALAVASGSTWPYALFVAAMGPVAWWVAETTEWRWLAWPIGIAAPLLVALLVARSTSGSTTEVPGSAWIAVVVLTVGYLTSFAWRAFVRSRKMRSFEVFETACVLLVGVLGLTALPLSPAVLHVIGGALTVAGLAVYGGARTLTPVRRIDLALYSTMALAFAVAGGACLLPGGWRDLWFLALAIGCFAVARGHDRFGHLSDIMQFHGILFTGLAASHANLGAYATRIWIARGIEPHAPALFWPAMAVVAVGLIASPRQVRGAANAATASAGPLVARVVLAAMLTFGLVTAAAGPMLEFARQSPRGATLTSPVITALLSLAAVLATLAARRTRNREWRWIGYAMLSVAGLQLVVDNVRHAGPSTLFAALAAYGLALTVVARLTRRRPDR